MKFICDQCKAKYQISDDKVAGKTVKMKCRKCGHMIEVRAAVTETSVAATAPREDGDKGSSPAAPPAAPGSGGAPARPGGPPRPGQLKTQPLATSLTGARPPAPARPGGAPGPGRTPAPGQTSALAGAFQRNVRDDEAAPAHPGGGGYELREISAGDEWYAAINGVPVGPIRVAELRRKAALGAVTDDSLVWQEGLEEWRPVRSFPELAEIVREAAAIGRPSLLPPTSWDPSPRDGAGGNRPSQRPPPPGRQTPAPAPAAMRAPPPPPQPAAAKSNVIPFSGRLATAEKLDDAPQPASARQQVAADPFAVPAPAVDPFAVPAAAAVAASLPVAPAPSRVEPQRPVPWIPIGMVALFAGFGGVAAMVMLQKPPVAAPAPAPSVIIIEKPVPMPNQPAAVESAVAAAPSASAAPTRPTGGAGAARPAASATGPAKIDIGGLLGGGPAGPSGGPSGPSGGGGSSLSSQQIEAVVASRKVAVRRACLERAESTSGNVSVRAKVTIGGNGLVQNVTATGNDPAIAGCIEKNVRTWTFPASGGTTTVDIPFSFLRQ